jgi:hypothetical protein
LTFTTGTRRLSDGDNSSITKNHHDIHLVYKRGGYRWTAQEDPSIDHNRDFSPRFIRKAHQQHDKIDPVNERMRERILTKLASSRWEPNRSWRRRDGRTMKLIRPTGPALYNENVWTIEDMRTMRYLYSDGLFFQIFMSGLQSFYAKTGTTRVAYTVGRSYQ